MRTPFDIFGKCGVVPHILIPMNPWPIADTPKMALVIDQELGSGVIEFIRLNTQCLCSRARAFWRRSDYGSRMFSDKKVWHEQQHGI